MTRLSLAYGLEKFNAPPGFDELVPEVPASLLPTDMRKDRRDALAGIVIKGVKVGIFFGASGEHIDTLNRGQLSAQLINELFELGFRSWDSDEAELIGQSIDIGLQWQGTGIFPVPLTDEAGMLGADASGLDLEFSKAKEI